MSNNFGYDEDKITTFIELAQETGIGPAMRELGYPKQWVTANKWFEQRGIDRPKSLTQQMAAVSKQLYTTEDKLVAGYALIDRINEQLAANDIDTMQLKQLAETFKKTIETIQILEGKATAITQTNDKFDATYQELIDKMEAKNKAFEAGVEEEVL